MWFWIGAAWLAAAWAAVLVHRRWRQRSPEIDPRLATFVLRLENELAQRHPTVRFLGMLPDRFACLLAVDGQETVVVLHVLEYGPFLGADLAFGPVFAAYLGMFLLSGMLLAFGCFASSLTDNVLLAALLTIMFDYGLLTLPRQIAGLLGEAGQDWRVRELLDKFDVMRNFSEWFARGLIDTSQVAFYVGGIAFFLCMTGISLAARRIG